MKFWEFLTAVTAINPAGRTSRARIFGNNCKMAKTLGNKDKSLYFLGARFTATTVSLPFDYRFGVDINIIAVIVMHSQLVLLQAELS